MTEQQRIERGQLWRLARDAEHLCLAAGDLVLVIQNNPYNVNAAYPWCLVAAVGMTDTVVPTHVPFATELLNGADITNDAGVRGERLGCVPKDWLAECVGQVGAFTMRRVERAVSVALALL